MTYNVKVLTLIEDRFLASVDRAVTKRADTMLRTLLHRRSMGGGNGAFPKSDIKKVHAHTQWTKKKTGETSWVLTNNHTNDGYHYPNTLASGKGWSQKVLSGSWTRLRKGVGGVFSTQMPNGLSPWIKIQTKHLKNDIILGIKHAK